MRVVHSPVDMPHYFSLEPINNIICKLEVLCYNHSIWIIWIPYLVAVSIVTEVHLIFVRTGA